jgi:uncharacterized protein
MKSAAEHKGVTMANLWDERRKALENAYFYRQEREKIEKMQTENREKLIRELCKNRCPKCGTAIQAMVFRGVPLDKCPGCGGVWLGPRDLQILAEKDHRTWFETWFKGEEKTLSETSSDEL